MTPSQDPSGMKLTRCHLSILITVAVYVAAIALFA